MTNIDKQRIAAVQVLIALGYNFVGGEWRAPAGTVALVAEADAMLALLMGRADALMGCTEGSAEETGGGHRRDRGVRGEALARGEDPRRQGLGRSRGAAPGRRHALKEGPRPLLLYARPRGVGQTLTPRPLSRTCRKSVCNAKAVMTPTETSSVRCSIAMERDVMP
jgi:hypothetical protein